MSLALIRRVPFTRWGLLIVSSVISLVLFLLTLEIAVRMQWLPDPIRYPAAPFVPDPYLGNRMRADAYEIDRNGWRNGSVPAKVDILCIGDSQTYGVGASRSQAYPQQLAEILGRTTYNMGLGGYGPVEYSHLVEEAMVFRPRVLTIGVYFGNDILDCYYASGRPVWGWLRSRDSSNGHKEQALNDSAATEDNMRRLLARSLDAGVSEPKEIDQALSNAKSWQDYLYPILFSSKAVTFLWYRVVRPISGYEYTDFLEADKVLQKYELEHGHPQSFVSYQDSSVYLQLTPNLRSTVEDTNIPAVQEGMRICLLMLERMDAFCRSNNVKCLFILIPTKELVYKEYLQSRDFKFAGYYKRLIESEDQNRLTLRSRLDSLKCSYVDLRKPLELAATDAALKGQLLYPHSRDGHPTERGYRVIAEEIARYIRQAGWMEQSK